MLSLFWQPLCSFVQPSFPMKRWRAAAAGAAATGAAAGSTEVGLGSLTLDVTMALRGGTL
jgi:hypothetical protein